MQDLEKYSGAVEQPAYRGWRPVSRLEESPYPEEGEGLGRAELKDPHQQMEGKLKFHSRLTPTAQVLTP